MLGYGWQYNTILHPIIICFIRCGFLLDQFFQKKKKIQNFSMTFYNTFLDFPCFSPTSMGTLVNTKCIYTGNIRGSPIQSYNPLLFVSSDVDFFLTKKVTTIQNFSMAFHNTFLDFPGFFSSNVYGNPG